MTLRQHIAERLDGERAMSRLLSVVGLLALTLAAIGLYGVVAYTAARRTREIGVRIALGAQPRDVVRLFVADALRLALGGWREPRCPRLPSRPRSRTRWWASK